MGKMRSDKAAVLVGRNSKKLNVTPQRIVISGIKPEIQEGRFSIKRTLGEKVVVEADIFAEGHDSLSCRLLVRRESEASWVELPMQTIGNDRWQGQFTVLEFENYYYSVSAVVDAFLTWSQDLRKRIEGHQNIAVDLLIGSELVEAASKRAKGSEAKRLKIFSEALKKSGPQEAVIENAFSEELLTLMNRYVDRSNEVVYPRQLRVQVDRTKARFSTWYEMFPRSCVAQGKQHGTFQDCKARLEYIAQMGFDVLYFPPIHPIGRAFRKGPNNNPVGNQEAVGSPWAIGSSEGGHTAIHPDLGTLADFRELVAAAAKHNIEIALDLAWQCSPDHPYVKEHPEWFRKRPDGSIQYAENPPKKYQDIFPINFETDEWKALWQELRDVVKYWIKQGVRIFRVDNPHTKPFDFWEWLITDIRLTHPEVIFLSEAFTRPKIMYELAKRGFTQSYTYFSWRNTKQEIEQYFKELTQTDVAEFFRPNLWPTTPDILTEYLQSGGRPAFICRLILAATLGASYGIYGPTFELCVNRSREEGSEEYLDSEKYEVRRWNLAAPHSLKEVIAQVNKIRRENVALQSDRSLVFHEVDNPSLIVFSKSAPEADNWLIVVVNLDPHNTQWGWTRLDLAILGIEAGATFQVHDLISDQWYSWHGERNYIKLDPQIMPAHIFRIQGRVRSEKDLEQYR